MIEAIDHENLPSGNWAANVRFGDNSDLCNDTDTDIDEDEQDIGDFINN